MSQTPQVKIEKEEKLEAKLIKEVEEELIEVKKGKALGRLFSYILAYKGRVIFVIIMVFLSAVCQALIPYFLGLGVDKFVELVNFGTGGDQIILYSIVMAGLALGFSLTRWIYIHQMSIISQKAMYSLRKDLFNHIQTLSLRFYDKQPVGELMSRVVNDIEAINQFLSDGIYQLFQALFTIGIIATIMLIINIWLALAVLVTLPLMIFMIYINNKYARIAFTTLQEELGSMNGFMEETISGSKTIKAYQLEEIAMERFDDVSDKVRKVDARANFLGLIIFPTTILITTIDLAIVGMVGGWFIAVLSVGTVVTFLSYARQFAQPMSQISQIYSWLLSAIAGASRVFEILDAKPQIVDKQNAPQIEVKDGHVEFEHVDFSYVPGIQILYDNTFKALPGQKIGLCGPKGACKSTIINLLTRFDDVQNGDISIDDQSIYDIKQDSLRKSCGIVLQVPYLFSESIIYNLRYGKLDATDEECIEAAKMAFAHDFIMRLPQGYDTPLSEGGGNLSQGQGQLLTIARAFLANPNILVLDEATSSVDTRTEKNIQTALARLMSGRTSFVIAHRLSTIADSDNILALDHGRIVDWGPHEKLLEEKGFYYRLWMSQFKEELMKEKEEMKKAKQETP